MPADTPAPVTLPPEASIEVSTLAHVLMVDDDDRIRRLVQRYLVGQGFRVSATADARAARAVLGGLKFDVLVLDIMMPGEDGLSLLTALREQGLEVPVLMLSARGATADRIEGLRAGADDYLSKPFEPEELVLRLKALLKRTRGEQASQTLRFAGLSFDPGKGELRQADGRHVRLTGSEVQLLRALAGNPGEPVSREALAQLGGVGADRSVDVAITRLRRKIEPDPAEPVVLQTVRGVGYRLVTD
jgi:two-component system phosphate regulon response regulator OmpR